MDKVGLPYNGGETPEKFKFFVLDCTCLTLTIAKFKSKNDCAFWRL